MTLGAPTPPRFAKPGALDCANADSFADELSLAQARRDELLSLVSSTKRSAARGSKAFVSETQEAGRKRLRYENLSSATRAFDQFCRRQDESKTHSAALAVMAGSVASANPKLTTELALKHGLPMISDRTD